MKILRVFFIMTYCFSHFVSANKYTLDYSMDLFSRYEDNVRFSFLEKQEVSAGIINVYGAFSRSTQISEINIFTNLNSSSYSDSLYNIDTQKIGFSYNRRFPTGNWSLRGNEANRSDREINLALGGGDLLRGDYQVDTQDLNFNFQKNFTERQNINIDIGLQTNDYEYFSRSDYDYWSSSALWQFTLNERLRFQGRLLYSDYLQLEKKSEVFSIFDSLLIPSDEETKQLCRQGDLNNFTSINGLPPCGYSQTLSFKQKNSGLQVGAFFVLNELISFDSLVGISKINNIRSHDIYLFPLDTNNYIDNGFETEETSTTYQVSIYYKIENVDTTLSTSSSNRIGGDGEVSPTIQYTLSNKWRLNKKNSFLSELSYLDRSLYRTTLENSDKVKTEKIMLGYAYNININWSLDLSYVYLKRTKSANNHASNKRIMLSMQWKPEEIQL